MTRLLLDEHLSGKVIGKALQESGHDVRAISGDKDLEGLDDEGVLERAIREERVLVTANIVDFVPLIIGLNKAGKSHPGCTLIPNSFSNEDFRHGRWSGRSRSPAPARCGSRWAPKE